MSTSAPLPAPGAFPPVPLAAIPTDEACQARVRVRPAVVRAYARAMSQQTREGGLRFPAVVLFTDGQRYWLGDGFHRVLAARAAGLTELPADVRPGTPRDALLYSVSSNAGHGMPRTNADKRKAVALLLADAEWGRWSDHELARRCHVSQAFVTKLRKGLSDNGYQIGPRKVQRGGTTYAMRVRTRSGPPAPPEQVETTPEPAPPAVPGTDRVGLPLPAGAAPAFASLSGFEAAEELLAQLAELVDQLAHSPGGAAFQQEVMRRVKDGRVSFYSPELHVFAQKLGAAAPFCGTCPRCWTQHEGRIQPRCKLCGGRGWLSKREFEVCPEPERQELRRRQNPHREMSPAPGGATDGPTLLARTSTSPPRAFKRTRRS
jgi:hypothetical protein